MPAVNVILPEKQDIVKDICHMLWARCFDDTEGYTNYYFNNRWNKSITLLLDNVSMLHLNPYDILINGEKTELYYIVGVCTLKKYRRRGYMDVLLKKALGLMYGMGKPFTYLMPAAEEIYKPYGFTGIYPVKSFNGRIPMVQNMDRQDKQCKKICVPYGMLEERQKKGLIQYTEKKLKEHFTCYPVHNESYFKGLYEEMCVCNGDILTFWDTDKSTCFGYAAYLCEEMPEIIESVFEEEIQEEILQYIERLGFQDIEIYGTNFWNLSYLKPLRQKNLLMARIVDLRAFVKCINTEEPQEMWLEVSDSLVSGNNGRWHIITGRKENICQKYEGSEGGRESTRYVKCTIEELGQKYFGELKYFLNELV